ncbi:hypothetical protein L1987_36229 [Smallanthus sonchifolius]|uniref:Uncharacterized protein n=1 Tax=Smallanthus sonchifolius TaxID=185202 RepID=A0ACB9HD05_9ASTR|nr:hypothetical protein L1987_36229 [Smallanthus sonchifolius]
MIKILVDGSTLVLYRIPNASVQIIPGLLKSKNKLEREVKVLEAELYKKKSLNVFMFLGLVQMQTKW